MTQSIASQTTQSPVRRFPVDGVVAVLRQAHKVAMVLKLATPQALQDLDNRIRNVEVKLQEAKRTGQGVDAQTMENDLRQLREVFDAILKNQGMKIGGRSWVALGKLAMLTEKQAATVAPGSTTGVVLRTLKGSYVFVDEGGHYDVEHAVHEITAMFVPREPRIGRLVQAVRAKRVQASATHGLQATAPNPLDMIHVAASALKLYVATYGHKDDLWTRVFPVEVCRRVAEHLAATPPRAVPREIAGADGHYVGRRAEDSKMVRLAPDEAKAIIARPASDRSDSSKEDWLAVWHVPGPYYRDMDAIWKNLQRGDGESFFRVWSVETGATPSQAEAYLANKASGVPMDQDGRSVEARVREAAEKLEEAGEEPADDELSFDDDAGDDPDAGEGDAESDGGEDDEGGETVRDVLGDPARLGENLIAFIPHVEGHFPSAWSSALRAVGKAIKSNKIPYTHDAKLVLECLDSLSFLHPNTAVLSMAYLDWFEEHMLEGGVNGGPGQGATMAETTRE